jgi:hypothetical protein
MAKGDRESAIRAAIDHLTRFDLRTMELPQVIAHVARMAGVAFDSGWGSLQSDLEDDVKSVVRTLQDPP